MFPLQLGGCGILGVGVWLSVTQGNFATLSSSLPSLSAANLLIAVGTIIMVIGCLGCVGAVKESRPLLLTVSCMPEYLFDAPPDCKEIGCCYFLRLHFVVIGIEILIFLLKWKSYISWARLNYQLSKVGSCPGAPEAPSVKVCVRNSKWSGPKYNNKCIVENWKTFLQW